MKREGARIRERGVGMKGLGFRVKGNMARMEDEKKNVGTKKPK